MPIACAFVPAFPVAAARLADPRLGGRPAIVVDRLERGPVLDLDEEARALGASVGMTLAAAAACAREAAIAVHDPAACRKLWEHALDALDAASPLIEDAACGTALLEMRGIAGSERHWIASVREAFASDAELARLPLRVAVGPSPFIARAAAQAEDGGIVRAGQERAFLAPLPLRFLDLRARSPGSNSSAYGPSANSRNCRTVRSCGASAAKPPAGTRALAAATWSL
jgi:nucleotidyltransferase/DNA polymerase involved in DNA repair